MKSFSIGTLLLLLTLSVFLYGQQTAPDNTVTPKSVIEAERAGTAHPRSEPPAFLGPGFERGGAEGSSERRCVEFPVGVEPANRRSGEIIVGGSIGALKSGQPGKVWWTPLHDPAGPKSTLIVRGARTDTADKTSLFTSKDYAWPLVGWTPDREHGFFPSGYSLPEPGRWLLTVTSGNDWGCFIVTVR